ncbi:unnamed protein product [Urochloa humidicola]
MTCGSFQLPSRGAEVRRTTDAAVKPRYEWLAGCTVVQRLSLACGMIDLQFSSSHKSRTSMKKQAKQGVRPNAQERQHCTRASIFMLPL